MSIDPDAQRLFEDVLGCKWTLAVLHEIAGGTVRPGRLRRAVPGLSTKVMQQRLRKLERYGLVSRRLVAAKPLHVEYRLTTKGRQLHRVVASVERVAGRWREA